MNDLQYWKHVDYVFWDYANHPEAKFDGDVVVLSRKVIVVNSVMHIGKESNNLEQAEILGVYEGDHVVHGKDTERLRPSADKILLAEPKDVKKYGISQRTLYNARDAILQDAWHRLSKKTIKQLVTFISIFKKTNGDTIARG